MLVINLGSSKSCLMVYTRSNLDCLHYIINLSVDANLRDSIGRTPLHYAAANSSFSFVRLLVETNAEVSIADIRGCTALHFAAAADEDGSMVEYLLHMGANPRALDAQGNTPLHYAALKGRTSALEKLIKCQNELFSLTPNTPSTTPLHFAAFHGHVDAISLLINTVIDVDPKDTNGRTPLDLASFRGHDMVVTTLVNAGANIWANDTQSGRTPVHAAAYNGHETCLRILLDNSDDETIVNAIDDLDRTPLMWSVLNGHPDTTVLLLKRNALPNASDRDRRTALHRGAAMGQEECVDILFQYQVDVALCDRMGRTALHLAAAGGHAGMLAALDKYSIQFHADSGLISAADRKGYTPLHWACFYGNDNCVECILESEEYSDFTGNSHSPLHCSSSQGHDTCTQLLLEHHGPSITNLKDNHNRTPLHMAAVGNHCETMQQLIAAESDVNAVNDEGRSVIMCAAAHGNCAAIELLLDRNVELSHCDQNGDTVLHLACKSSAENAVLLVLDKMDDTSVITKANQEGETALHLAARDGMVPVTQTLISKGASVFAVDGRGRYPALSCAANERIADCLELIISQMMSVSGGTPRPSLGGRNSTGSATAYINSTIGMNSLEYSGGERVLKDTKELSGSVKSCVSDSSDQYF